MNKRPVIAVIGATGAQGGGLMHALLADPQRRFTARALTRQPLAERARRLAAFGADVVAANLDEADTLIDAFRGVHGVFAVTDFWEHLSPDRELRQADNIAHAARAAGVKHVVWSTLEDTRLVVPSADVGMPAPSGRYNVPHFDAKGEANARFDRYDVPTTFLKTSFFWDNLIHFGMGPVRGADGALSLLLPMGDRPLPGIAAADIGPCAFGLFAVGPRTVGRSFGIASEHLTGKQMARALSRALGEPVRHVDMDPSDYAALGVPGAAELASMFRFKCDFNDAYCAARPVDLARALHPGVQTFSEWLRVVRIPVPPIATTA